MMDFLYLICFQTNLLSCFHSELDAKDRETVQKLYDAIQETADTWENKLL